MTERPLVSVLIINHDCAGFMVQAIETALDQDLPRERYEVIVVDDGSTDDSAERAKPYLDRIRWIGKPNTGQVSSFNMGFKECRGRYIAVLESDDYWDKNKLSRCAEWMEKNPDSALLQHWLLMVGEKGEEIPGYDYPTDRTSLSLDEFLAGKLLYNPTSGLVFDADKLRKYMPFPERFFYGTDLCLRLAAGLLGPMGILPELLGYRRIHGANIFGESLFDRPDKIEKTLRFHASIMAYYRDFLAEHGRKMPEELWYKMDMDRLHMELFLHRYRWEPVGTLRAWGQAVRLCGLRPYALFKGAALLLVCLSPSLYLGLQDAYRDSWLMRLRGRLFASKEEAS